MYEITVNDHWFNLIISGDKIVEGRPWCNKHCLAAAGVKYTINNKSNTSTITGIIKEVYWYPSFEQMLKVQGCSNVLPGVRSIEDGIKLYHSFPDYEVLAQLYGVVAIVL